MRTKNRPITLERLETRHLLAIDLSVEHDVFEPAEPGEEVTRVIRVFNHGDEVAKDVLVQSSLTDELENPTWERRTGNAKLIREPHRDMEPDFQLFEPLSGYNFETVDDVLPVGDMNGDGLEDFVFHYKRFERRVGRVRRASLVFGGLGSDIERQIGFVEAPTGLNFSIPEDNHDRFEPLGDVNGDGLSDLAFGGIVILGATDLTERQTIDPFDLSTHDGFIVSAYQLYGIGDPNGDGIDDIVGSQTNGEGSFLIWGRSDIDAALPTVEQTSTGVLFDSFVADASSVGDLNGDGFQDFALNSFHGSAVFLGSKDIASRQIRSVEFMSGREFGSKDFGFTLYSTDALSDVAFDSEPIGDFDGDGFDDMLLEFTGGNCDCTVNDRLNSDANGGAVVLFGGAHWSTIDAFDVNSHRYGKYSLASREMRHQRTATDVIDINDDGRNELRLYGSGVSYIVSSDVDSSSEVDLGFGGWWPDFEYQPFTGFNGENGFGTLGDLILIDINGDGVLDDLVQATDRSYSVYLGASPAPEIPVKGMGNIKETVTVPPDSSVIYSVTGRLKSESNTITTSASSRSQSEADLRDNIISEREAVDLEVMANVSPFEPGERITVDFTIRNRGPADAVDFLFEETLSQHMSDVQWTTRANQFPASFSVDNLQDKLGVGFVGPDRVHHGIPSAPGYDREILTALGGRVGSLGDTDQDGFDEVFATSRYGSFRFDGDDVAVSELLGDFEPISDRHVPAEEPAFGDFNGDGFLDAVMGAPNSRGKRGAVYAVFGTEEGIPTATVAEPNGAHGIVLIGEELGQSVGYSVAAGDVNGDGMDDIIFSEGCEYCDFKAGRNNYVRSSTLTNASVFVVLGNSQLADSPPPKLSDLDGANGFRIDLMGNPSTLRESRHTDVASRIDFNGDGVDDIVIGDTGAGEMTSASYRHGGIYVILGRKTSESIESIAAPIETTIPFGGRVTYTLTGLIPGSEPLETVANAIVRENSYVELNPSSNSVALTVQPTLHGDVDGNGEVNLDDFSILADNFGAVDAAMTDGDLDGNQEVNFLDFLILAENLGRRLG